jgi:hypothetical protein
MQLSGAFKEPFSKRPSFLGTFALSFVVKELFRKFYSESMFPRHIYYVSAECEAGKSQGARCYIKDHLFQQNFVYVAPSLH